MDILIAPDVAKKLVKIILPQPKDEKPQHILYDEDNLALYEIVQYRDDFRSWFIDNQLISDGQFKMLTKIDPLFIFVTQFIKYAKDQFRPLGDICQDYEQFIATSKSNDDASFLQSSSKIDKDKVDIKFDRLDYALAPDIKWDNICDTRLIDDELFVRFSEVKTLDWLVKKHARLMSSLEAELSCSASKATLISYALDLLDEYVHESLSIKFKDAVRRKQYDNKSNSDNNKSAISQTTSKGPTSKRSAPSSAQAASTTKAPTPAGGIARFFIKK